MSSVGGVNNTSSNQNSLDNSIEPNNAEETVNNIARTLIDLTASCNHASLQVDAKRKAEELNKLENKKAKIEFKKPDPVNISKTSPGSSKMMTKIDASTKQSFPKGPSLNNDDFKTKANNAFSTVLEKICNFEETLEAADIIKAYTESLKELNPSAPEILQFAEAGKFSFTSIMVRLNKEMIEIQEKITHLNAVIENLIKMLTQVTALIKPCKKTSQLPSLDLEGMKLSDPKIKARAQRLWFAYIEICDNLQKSMHKQNKTEKDVESLKICIDGVKKEQDKVQLLLNKIGQIIMKGHNFITDVRLLITSPTMLAISETKEKSLEETDFSVPVEIELQEEA